RAARDAALGQVGASAGPRLVRLVAHLLAARGVEPPPLDPRREVLELGDLLGDLESLVQALGVQVGDRAAERLCRPGAVAPVGLLDRDVLGPGDPDAAD